MQGTVLANGMFSTTTYAACCQRCQARIECGGFFLNAFRQTCELFSWGGAPVDSGYYDYMVGIMTLPSPPRPPEPPSSPPRPPTPLPPPPPPHALSFHIQIRPQLVYQTSSCVEVCDSPSCNLTGLPAGAKQVFVNTNCSGAPTLASSWLAVARSDGNLSVFQLRNDLTQLCLTIVASPVLSRVLKGERSQQPVDWQDGAAADMQGPVFVTWICCLS